MDGVDSVIVLEASKPEHFQRSVSKNAEQKSRQVTYLRREYRRNGDTLAFNMHMGVDGAEPYHHLACKMQL